MSPHEKAKIRNSWLITGNRKHYNPDADGITRNTT